MRLFKFIGDIFNVFSKARDIRQNEDTRKKSVVLGLTSIIYSLISVALVFGGAFLFTLTDNLLAIFIIIIAIILLVGAVVTFLGALLRVIAQFTVNRNAMSWIALIIFIAAIVASVLIVMNFLG